MMGLRSSSLLLKADTSSLLPSIRPSSLADCLVCRRLNAIAVRSLQGVTRGSLQARLKIVLRCGSRLGLTEAASVAHAQPCGAQMPATHAEGSKTVWSAASSRAEGSRTPES
jgi:hypothetical protein